MGSERLERFYIEVDVNENFESLLIASGGPSDCLEPVQYADVQWCLPLLCVVLKVFLLPGSIAYLQIAMHFCYGARVGAQGRRAVGRPCLSLQKT